MNVLEQFESSQTEEQRKKADAALNSASGDGKGKTIDVAGSYRMMVKTVVSNKGVWPCFEISSQPKTMGDLVLKVMLEAMDDTGPIHKGDVTFLNVYVKKGPGATDKKMQDTAAFAKPILCALAGKKDIVIDTEFLSSTFSVDVVDGRVVRDHKMKTPLYVVIEPYTNPTTGATGMSVKSIRMAKDGDVSSSVKSSAPVTDGALANEVASSMGTMQQSEMNMDDDMPLPGGVKIEDY